MKKRLLFWVYDSKKCKILVGNMSIAEYVESIIIYDDNFYWEIVDNLFSLLKIKLSFYNGNFFLGITILKKFVIFYCNVKLINN